MQCKCSYSEAELGIRVNISVVELDSTVADIAKKWFGVEEVKNRHTIVQDGLVYLQEALKQGVKFDVIVLDACDEAIRAPCPAKVFRTVKVIENFKKALTSSGCLIVNILSNDYSSAESSSQESVNQDRAAVFVNVPYLHPNANDEGDMLTQIGTNVDPLYVKNESHSTLVRSVPYLGAEVVSAVKQSYYDDPSLTGVPNQNRECGFSHVCRGYNFDKLQEVVTGGADELANLKFW
ncbi:hypothetical protein ANCCEY_13907 [Ancylostoma ceylanicum]|uniref:PABS domain-containing protein n=1 Tax=Ancylostoma ceylanicum TaxID=53326 RepID=A0A0D6LB30_9BILA|nr:hypothetical protein ANCCEY_13907 [Ancylostoma ceylanicum]